MSFVDKTLTCRECGNEFTWTAGEQQFYAEKGLVNTPSRCTDCRRQRRSAGGSGGMGGRDRAPRAERTNRIQFPVVCASCGKETTVPFEPKHDRPVYCSDCFDRSRAGAR